MLEFGNDWESLRGNHEDLSEEDRLRTVVEAVVDGRQAVLAGLGCGVEEAAGRRRVRNAGYMG